MALSDCEAPAPNADVLTPSRLSAAVRVAVGDEVIRSSVVLLALSAREPWFKIDQLTESEPPGATLVEPNEMLVGIKSDWAAGGGGGGGGGGGLTVKATECCRSLLVLLWLVTVLKSSAMTQT